MLVDVAGGVATGVWVGVGTGMGTRIGNGVGVGVSLGIFKETGGKGLAGPASTFAAVIANMDRPGETARY